MEELQHLQPNDGSKQKMLDILKRFHSEDEADIMDEDGKHCFVVCNNESIPA